MQTSKRDPFRKPGVADEIEAQLRMQEERRIEAERLAKAEKDIARLGRFVRWGAIGTCVLAVVIALVAAAYVTGVFTPKSAQPIVLPPELPRVAVPTATPTVATAPLPPPPAVQSRSTVSTSSSTQPNRGGTNRITSNLTPPAQPVPERLSLPDPASDSSEVAPVSRPVYIPLGVPQSRSPVISNPVLPTPLPFPGQGVSEYGHKAAFLAKFPQFVKWPPGHTSITVGILGENPFGNAVHPKIKHSRNPDDLRGLEIVFISRSEHDHIGEILNAFADTSTLTVGETEGFARQGGIIGFTLEGDKVRFEINLAAARRAGLVIDQRLLKLATRVIN